MKIAMGSVIAVVLLGVYVYAVITGIVITGCWARQCSDYGPEAFTVGMQQALTLVGGLVSALVIAELAVTKPGDPPMARVITGAMSKNQTGMVKATTALYILVWIAAGAAAYVVGQMQHPGMLPALTDLGQSWLGLAVSAAYAYFGINPTQEPDSAGSQGREETSKPLGAPTSREPATK